MPGGADRQPDRCVAAHLDHLFPRHEGGAAVGSQIAGRVCRIDLLDEQILDIAGRCREAPGNAVIVPDDNQGDAGDGAAGYLAVWRFQPRQVPEPRRGKAEMRIIGEDRLAAVGMCAIDDPVVRGINRSDPWRQRRIKRIERQLAINPRQFGQRRRGIFRVFGIKHGEVVGRHGTGEPGAQQFASVISRQFEIHQLAPGDAVGRAPRLGPEGEKHKLGRQSAAARREEGVHACRVGLQRAADRRR